MAPQPSYIRLAHTIITVSYVGTIISNGPQDTTVCINATAEYNCGFTGANPNHVIPNWRIVFRSDNGNIISNITHDGVDVVRGRINGLQWVADLTGGNNNALNSKLLVGPVNKTHNQSSYQCFIPTVFGPVISSMGTMTVVGKKTLLTVLITKKALTDPPSVAINVDKICTTSMTISLNSHSHPACGDVSHNVTISGRVIYPDTIGSLKYTINELQSDTLYNIAVTSTYGSGSREIAQLLVRTSPSESKICDYVYNIAMHLFYVFCICSYLASSVMIISLLIECNFILFILVHM